MLFGVGSGCRSSFQPIASLEHDRVKAPCLFTCNALLLFTFYVAPAIRSYAGSHVVQLRAAQLGVRQKTTQWTASMRNERHCRRGCRADPWTRRLRASRSIASMLFSSFNRSQPSLAAIQPKFVGREQTRRCVIERTCADFDLASSIHDAVK
jgi:hypothetical protein